MFIFWQTSELWVIRTPSDFGQIYYPISRSAGERFSTSTVFSSSKMMADPTDYKALFLRAEEERRHEAELRRQAEQGERQERERNRQTTFEEFIRHCHDLLSRPLRAEEPSRSTTGKIPAPAGKHCPLRLLPWTDCSTKQHEIYNSVRNYLQPVGRDAPRLFAPIIALEDHGRRFARRLAVNKISKPMSD